jgi:hypothetical protein
MASRLGATINKILDLCRAHSQVIAVLHQARGRAALLLALVFVCRLLFFVGKSGTASDRKEEKSVRIRRRLYVQGLPQKVLDEELQDVEVEIMKQSLNFLLQKVPYK